MSHYASSRYDDDDDEPRRYHNVRTRPRERDEPDYVREETYIERGKGPGPRDLVYRGRDESVEDIPRDFPPPGRRRYDDYAPRRTRSTGGRPRRYDDYDDDRSDYIATGAAGAAGYAAGRHSRRNDRRRRDDRDYDSDYSDSPPRRNHERSKSGGVGEVLESLGLGGVVGGLLGANKDKDHDRTRSRSRGPRSRRYSDASTTRSRSRGPGDKKRNERKWAQAAQAALVAGAVEAFRSRKEAGPWTGEKGKRIATAALGAGGIDGLLDRDPDKKTKRHLAEAVIGGLATTRLANGPRSKSRGRNTSYSPDGRAPRSRSRSRSIIDKFRGRSASRGPGGQGGGDGAVKGLVAGGALAAAGKAIYDRVRSKSRKRRSPSNSSADSYVPSRNRRRDKRRSPPSDTGSTRRSLATGGRDRGLGRGTDGNDGADAAVAGAAGGAAGALGARNKDGAGSEKRDDSSDSSSTTDMENKRKHMKGKELLTAGLATIATIHAAHGVYSSMEAHEKRHRLVAEGEMSPEEARKKQTKAWVQDAAAVGIAALGIKGAFSEWKEMKEQRREIHEIEKRKRDRRKKVERQAKQEEHDRQERMLHIMSGNPQMAFMMQQNGGKVPNMPNMQMPSLQIENSGNPYSPQGR
ncbi:Hypothetical protein R9X50_00243100 [Acrodontium crateriforme]|uniref:Uncharacterized protein n=1 Tax=Acrodontium crateriforme TaxID=150365 RepID=A0AAQ3M0Z5_9PEZI|nr:Hypothetical protein R9X50_00243100 [Acrodontium crateriforme]